LRLFIVLFDMLMLAATSSSSTSPLIDWLRGWQSRATLARFQHRSAKSATVVTY